MRTAVDILYKFLYEMESFEGFDPYSFNQEDVFKKAKEMEKEQIIESYCQGCFDMWKDNGIVPRETADEYYNETFIRVI
jgi:predicted adenine nucleotide alpha hydrolase (AANH) superfamily ATPase